MLALTRISAYAHCFIGMTGVVNVSGGCAPSGWSAGPDMPTAAVSAVGVYFPATATFMPWVVAPTTTPGSELTNPLEYDPGTNSWTTKAATYPDNHVNNMACGVLADAGTPYIYCVGGSAVTLPDIFDRVFRYDPVTDVISPVAAPWPGCPGNDSARWLHSLQQQALYPGRIRHHHERRASDQPDLGVYSQPGRLGAEECCSACSARLYTDDDYWLSHLHRWGHRYHRWRSYRYNKLLCI